MKILIVGGTGMIGGNAALLLREKGHEVTIMSRSKPVGTAVSDFGFIQGNYIDDDCSDGRLQGFDQLVFSAAADIRNLPQDGSISPEDFYEQANNIAVPKFFEAAKAAGIRRAVYIGSFYPQVAPHRIEVCPYVHSRHVTDEAVRAMSCEDFTVCRLNAPYVLGTLSGLEIPHLQGLVAYATGNLDLPLFAPEGGTNHINALSLAEAIDGALQRGMGGTAYLVGDENYSWKEYLELWAAAAGKPVDLEVRADEHPMLPSVIMFAGVGATVSYEPDPEETALLGYGRNRIKQEIADVVAQLGG